MINKVGVLALQGAFREHEKVLLDLGLQSVQVRNPTDLETIEALILPGGESTTMRHLLQTSKLLEPIREFSKNHIIWGTCAGAILLAKNIEEDAKTDLPPSLEIMNITIKRNAYGRQIDSFEQPLAIEGLQENFLASFIRAPVITKVSENIEILAKYNKNIVFVKDNNIFASSFHPELTKDYRIHKLVLGL